MDTLQIVKQNFLEEDPTSQWDPNSRRLTTTDALNIDWWYCNAVSAYTFENKDYTPGINTHYINKETTNCAGKDRIGIIRPVFNDRICDGFVDCFDASDENNVLGQCEIDNELHPFVGNPSVEILDSNVVIH